MSKSRLQSPLGRALVLTLATSSLATYVGLVSCSKAVPQAVPATAAPQAAQAVPQPASNVAAPQPAAQAPPANLVPTPPPRIYGPASKSGIVRIPRDLAPKPNEAPPAGPQ